MVVILIVLCSFFCGYMIGMYHAFVSFLDVVKEAYREGKSIKDLLDDLRG